MRNGRRYELLSEFETLYFHLLERKQSVVDIREQFPIFEIGKTIELAARFGLDHKRKGAFPEPYTIDFLVTERVDGQETVRAASIKPPGLPLDERTLAKLRVEEAWCREKGIAWELIDMSEDALPQPLVTLQVLRFLRGWYRNRWVPDPELQALIRSHFKYVYERNVALATLLRKLAKRLRLAEEQADDAFRYAAWVGDVPISLHHEIALNLPLVLKRNAF